MPAGLVPTMRPTTVAPAHFSWNYTTYLNLVFLALFGVLYWLYRNRERLGGGDRSVRDPVCGMQVEIAHAPAVREHAGVRHYFCSDHCAEQFEPDRHGGDHATRKGTGAMQQERIIEQLEKMVASGRITPEEAARLRASAGTPEFDAVMGEIRARHAQVHTDAAVAAGR